MSTIAADARLASSRAVSRAHRSVRRRRYLSNAGTLVLSVALLVWTILPIYNMVMISLEPEGDVFTDHLWPKVPSVESFWAVLTQGHWYLEHFWRQFANSLYMGAMVTFFALLFGSLTSFSIGRMRIRHGWLVSNAALLTYVIPASFLAIPFYRIMQNYGLANNLWSVIAALVSFATPYAIFVFQEYGRSIPIEVDESARIDGASPLQIYLRIYLPLMAPALVAVGTYALLLAWNEYLYQFLLLSSKSSMTVPVALAQFLNSDQSPWNYMMATAIVYALPPVAIYYAFRRRMTAGLTMGGVKG
jgi:multiple sugar transport system permease protein